MHLEVTRRVRIHIVVIGAHMTGILSSRGRKRPAGVLELHATRVVILHVHVRLISSVLGELKRIVALHGHGTAREHHSRILHHGGSIGAHHRVIRHHLLHHGVVAVRKGWSKFGGREQVLRRRDDPVVKIARYTS